METPYDKNVMSPYLIKPQYLHLSKGSKVEVTSKSEGLVGSWFEATVLKPPENPRSSLKNKRLTLIEYVNLVNEEGTLLLREKVDHVLLRPLPPKFVVEVGDGFREGDLVDCFERDGWWTGVVKSVARVKVGDGNGDDDDDDDDDEQEERYLVEFENPEHEIEFRKEDLRVHLDWMDGKWCRLRNDVLQELSITSGGDATLANYSSRSGPEELAEPEVDKGISAETPANEPATLLDQNMSPHLSARCQRGTISLEYPDSSSTHSPPSKKLKGTCADPFVLVSTKSTELTIEDSNGPSRCVARGLGLRDNGISPLRDCLYKDSHGTSDPGVRDSSHFKRGFKRRKTMKQVFAGTPTAPETEAEEVDGLHKDRTMEEYSLIAVGRELTHEKHGEVQVDENIHKIPCMEEQTHVSVGAEMTDKQQDEIQKAEDIPRNPSLELEAVSTDVIHEEPGTPNLANDALVPVFKGTMVSPDEGRLGSNGSQGMSESLPFVKKSPIWKAVEALEMFRLFPQKPHFQPLTDEKERSREGLAIGKMITFASTVVNVVKLSRHSPVSSFTDCLETLCSLKTHGFNTKTIEHRVSKLLSIKQMQGKVDEKKKEVCSQISDLKLKNEKLVEDVYASTRKIKFYKQRLALALLEKEVNELEITSLTTRLDVIDTVMDSALFDFVD